MSVEHIMVNGRELTAFYLQPKPEEHTVVEHYEEYSASDECYSASCDECGSTMMVGDEGWFRGWDEITEWTEEGSDEPHKGYVLHPIFRSCPNCGRKVEK